MNYAAVICNFKLIKNKMLFEIWKNNDKVEPGKKPAMTLSDLPVASIHPAVLLGTVFINLLALALPLVVLQVYDRILPNQALQTFALLIMGLFIALVFDGILRIARAYLVGWSAACYENEMSVSAVERILFTPSRQVEQTPPGTHIDRLNAIDALRDFYGGQSRLLLIDLPFVVVFLGLVAFIGGWLVMVPVAMFAILTVITMMCGNRLRDILIERAQQDDRRHDFIIESLNGIQTIKTMALEPQIQRRFERLQKAGVEASYQTIILGNMAQNFGNMFSSLTMISVVSIGAYFVIGGTLSIGTLAACTLLSGRSVQPVIRGLGLWTQLQGLSIVKSRLLGLYDLPDAEDRSLANSTEIVRGEIKLENATFIHEGAENPSVDNLTITIAPGTMIGLHGGDGSGKSTVVKMIAGALEPTLGKVTIDGFDAAGSERIRLAKSVAYVPQLSSIFTGTILQNITMFNTGDAIDAARDAAQLIGLEVDIHRLPQGYDTMLSEGIADEMPMGMMQRIMIARSIARQPGILLFDEANSSLDARADKMLREAFRKLKGKITIVIVSHRPSLLRLCHQIYELKDGKIASSATGASAEPDGTPDNTPPDQDKPQEAIS